MRENIIRLARKIAMKSKHNMPMAAVIHKNSKVYSFGFNDGLKTHPLYQETGKVYNLGHHAELSALIGVRHSTVKNLEITVVRISRKTGLLTSSKPCNHCMMILKEFGIKKIHYSESDGTFKTIRIA